MKTLGQTLKDARELIPMTLRQVEDATGISNAYNSQLENDKIKKPSAHVLYKLSNLYKIDLKELLLSAGLITKAEEQEFKNTGKSIKNLTQKEYDQLCQYLKFLRQNK